eukprot:2740491-Prymnesium_polylepis.1
MDAILHLLRERTACETAALHVKLLNDAAVSFYRKYGFRTRPDEDFCKDHYYIDGKHYDAQYFQQDLRTGFLGVIKAYCSLL